MQVHVVAVQVFICDSGIYHFCFAVCYQSALPFVGFGFLDNVIMITVVSYYLSCINNLDHCVYH